MNMLSYVMHFMWKNKIGLLLVSVGTVLMVNTYFAAGALAMCVAGLMLAIGGRRDQSGKMPLWRGIRLSLKKKKLGGYTPADVARKYKELNDLVEEHSKEDDELLEGLSALREAHVAFCTAGIARVLKVSKVGAGEQERSQGQKIAKVRSERSEVQLRVEHLERAYKCRAYAYLSTQEDFDQSFYKIATPREQMFVLEKNMNDLRRAHRMEMEAGEALLQALHELNGEVEAIVEGVVRETAPLVRGMK